MKQHDTTCQPIGGKLMDDTVMGAYGCILYTLKIIALCGCYIPVLGSCPLSPPLTSLPADESLRNYDAQPCVIRKSA